MIHCQASFDVLQTFSYALLGLNLQNLSLVKPFPCQTLSNQRAQINPHEVYRCKYHVRSLANIASRYCFLDICTNNSKICVASLKTQISKNLKISNGSSVNELLIKKMQICHVLGSKIYWNSSVKHSVKTLF